MPATDRAAFQEVFPSLAEDILAYAKESNLPENALQWFEKVYSPFFARFAAEDMD